MSLTTSLVGGGPEGGVTLGSLESGPLVGVLAAVVGVEAVEGGFAGVVAVMRALSSLFWLPTVIVFEPPDPQPAITAAAPSAASTGSPRRAGLRVLKLVTGGQPSEVGPIGTPLRSEVDRARRGGSGALHPQSALAGLNSPPRGSVSVAPSLGAVSARAPRGAGSRTRSGPEGSSLNPSPAGAAGGPREGPQSPVGGPGPGGDEGWPGHLGAAPGE